MIKIKIIVVDRTRSSFLKEGESFYLKRLRRYAQVEWIEVRPAKITKGRATRDILNEEGQAITRKLAQGDYVVALDRSGRQYDSEGLSRWLNALSVRMGGWVSMIIGGPLGLSEKILSESRESLSLSKLTLTHEMCRLLLLEQFYRAFTILRGEKYHK